MALGVLCTFVVSLVVGLVIHLDLAVTRAATRDVINAILADTFAGTVRVGELVELTPRSIAVASFSAETADGEPALRVEGVRLSGAWWRRVVGLAFGADLEVVPARVERVEVNLDRTGDELAVVRAFALAPEPPRPPSPDSHRRPKVVIPRIELVEVVAIGELAPGVKIDGTLQDVLASLDAGPAGVAVHVDRCRLHERGVVGAPIAAELGYHLVADAGTRVSMWADATATVGALALSARATFEDGVIAAEVTSAAIGPDELAPWVAEVPLAEPVSAVARVFGRPPLLHAEADVALPAMAGGEPGRLSLRGRIALDQRPELIADLEAVHLDGRLVGREPSDVQAAVRVRAELAGADTELFTLLRVGPSVVLAEPVGPLEGTARISRAGVDATFALDEPGAPTDVEVRYRAGDESVAFAVRADADLQRLGRLGRLLREAGQPPGPRRGTAAVTAEGTFDDGVLEVATRARLRGVVWPETELALGSAVVDARIAGPPSALSVDADVHGGGLVVGGDAVSTFAASAEGPIAAPRVIARAQANGRELVARGLLDTANRSARGVQVDVTHGVATVRTTVKTVRVAPGGVALDGITIAGLGAEVTGGLRVEGGELIGKLQGDGIDLKHVSRAIGLPFTLRGSVDLDLDLRRTKGGREGHVAATLHDGGFLVINGVQAELRADFDGKSVIPSASIRLVNESVREGSSDVCGGTIATVKLDEGQGAMDGPLLDPATWRNLAGSVRVTATDAKLRCVAEVWQQFNPIRDLPFRKIEGILNASAILSRESRQRFPSLDDVHASTTALVFEAQPGDGDGEPPFITDRLDLVLFGALDGKTGKTDLGLHLIESEKRTDLAKLTVAATLDLPEVALGGEEARRSLIDTAWSAGLRTVRGPASRFAALPEPVRKELAGVEGDVEVDAFLEGTLRDPSAAIRARAWGLGHTWGLPTDVDVLASYHGGAGRLDAKVRRDGVAVATVTGESKGNIQKRLLGETDERWTGWLAAHLDALPLETLPPLARAQISGAVSGELRARGLGDKPHITMAMKAPELTVGRVKFVGAEVAVEPVGGGGGMFTVFGRLPQEKRGGLTVRAYANLAWRDELIPLPDTTKPAGLHVVADRFPLATAEPLLPGIVSRVDGYLDGELRVRYRELGQSKAAVDVNMEIVDGAVSLPGQELTEIGAKITSKPSIIEVKDIAITAHEGKATGSVNVRLDGLELTDVTGSLEAKEETPMPLVLDGMPLGSASGTLLVHYERGRETAPDRLELSVADLLLRLPASSTRQVQSLDDHGDVSVSVPLGPPRAEPEGGADRNNLMVTVALDKTVIEKGQTRVVISTTTPLVIQPNGQLSGEIAVIGGELNLLGKIFRFERGLVRLRKEEANNPYVNVTAYWHAPNGTLIYIDYVGLLLPLSQEKITFRSSPPLGEQELLALLILGEGGSAEEGGAERAGALSRGIAAAQFNALLGDIAPGLSTSFAGGDGYIGTTVIYQVSDSVTARATVEQADATAAGEQTSGTATADDQGIGARTSVSIDWRFAPNWLLRGTLGVGQQASSGLDLLYQFRY